MDGSVEAVPRLSIAKPNVCPKCGKTKGKYPVCFDCHRAAQAQAKPQPTDADKPRPEEQRRMSRPRTDEKRRERAEKAIELRKQGMSINAAAERLGVGHSTLYADITWYEKLTGTRRPPAEHPARPLMTPAEKKRQSKAIVEALARRKEAGLLVGRSAFDDAATIQRVVELRQQGLSHGRIVAQLEAEGRPTARGGAWHKALVRKILERAGVDLPEPPEALPVVPTAEPAASEPVPAVVADSGAEDAGDGHFLTPAQRQILSDKVSIKLSELKEQGVRLGPPPLDNPQTIERIAELRQNGATFRSIAKTLTQEGIPTKRGGNWGPETIRKVLNRYPEGSTPVPQTEPSDLKTASNRCPNCGGTKRPGNAYCDPCQNRYVDPSPNLLTTVSRLLVSPDVQAYLALPTEAQELIQKLARIGAA